MSSSAPAGRVALDVQDAVREVDVPPPEREQLALPQPGERRDDEHRREQVVGGRSRDGVDLLDGQHVELVAAPHGDLLGVLARVRRDPALALRAGEDAVQQDHHLLHRPVRERLPAEQLLAERVDVRAS